MFQLNEVLPREKGRTGNLPSVAVGRVMVWQLQLKSLSPRGIVSEITVYKKMFVQFGFEEENRRYTPIMNNVISSSVCKSVCQGVGGC